MRDETYYSLALALVPGLGISRLHQIIKQCGSPVEVFKGPGVELRHLQLSHEIRSFISSGCALREAEKTMKETQEKQIRILSMFDCEYPHLLKEIFEPPVVVYCRGELKALRQPSLAIVGSRRCSVYGKQVTQKLSRELASMGLTVVSGLARGIDSQAHIGAIESKGTTVAVLGNGVDVIYPRENRRLYEQIRDIGCVVSEFPCGAFPAPQNFPIRNRIISGLCYGTIITEASEFSGSLITARLTLEQNRELCAVPGNITSPGSYGPNYLIKQGAKIVLDVQDVLDELPLYVLDSLALKEPAAGLRAPEEPLSKSQENILKLLATDASIHFDRLLQISKMSQSRLNEGLLQLEMKGRICQSPGRRFSRKLV